MSRRRLVSSLTAASRYTLTLTLTRWHLTTPQHRIPRHPHTPCIRHLSTTIAQLSNSTSDPSSSSTPSTSPGSTPFPSPMSPIQSQTIVPTPATTFSYGGDSEQYQEPIAATEHPLSHYVQYVGEYADRRTTGVTLRQMFNLGQKPNAATLIGSAQFLHKEMPIRLAKRIRDLSGLPFGLSSTAAIQHVNRLYQLSFADFLAFPTPMTPEDEMKFTEMVKAILTRHQHIVFSMAAGMRQSLSDCVQHRDQKDHFLLQEFLDRFNIARIGIRMLLAQHVALHEPREGYVGVIHGKCSPANVCQDAIRDAEHMCKNVFGIAPCVTINDMHRVTCRYVPAHLRYMLFELLKNSMRAVVEFHRAQNPGKKDSDITFPPIQVVIADGESDVIIKVSDRGGGIARHNVPLIYSYSFTTAPNATQEHKIQDSSRFDSAGWLRGGVGPVINAGGPMFGDAFGLPLSRLYARYFGGDLQIFSMHGHGTDAFLYLNKLGNSDEVLPD